MPDWLLHGTIPVGNGSLYVREVVGNLFGLTSPRTTAPTDTPAATLEGAHA